MRNLCRACRLWYARLLGTMENNYFDICNYWKPMPKTQKRLVYIGLDGVRTGQELC